MSDGHGPTNADLMRRLNEIVGKVDKHDTEIKTLKADRELVRRLHTHVHDVAEKVTVIHELLSNSERLVADTLRLSVRELSNQMTAAVRAEMSGLRDEVKELREAVEARPCAEMSGLRDEVKELREAVEARPCLGDGAACPQELGESKEGG